jgi:hypothetical protein
MATQRISTDHPDLAPVFGALDDAQRARVVELLETADARLTAVHETLNERTDGDWETEGVVLETEVSGQASINVSVEDAKGTLTFAAELRPRNFFGDEENPWRPGRPPLVMATDAWEVEGSIDVRFKTRVAGRPYTIQQQVVELEERRRETPEAAAEAFAAICEELAELALSREATVAAWKPEEEAEEAPAGAATGATGGPDENDD